MNANNKSEKGKLYIIGILYCLFIIAFFSFAIVHMESEYVFWSLVTALFLALYLSTIDYKSATINTFKISLLDFVVGGVIAVPMAIYQSYTVQEFVVKFLGVCFFFAYVARGKLLKVILHIQQHSDNKGD